MDVAIDDRFYPLFSLAILMEMRVEFCGLRCKKGEPTRLNKVFSKHHKKKTNDGVVLK
jgi:hypothetical protein